MGNKEHQLGLPIEYQEMPEFFDAHNVNEQTEAKNALIEKLLRKCGVKTILDMTCGTGSQVFYLAEQGYDIVGSDFSPALVEIARNKAKEMNRPLVFVNGDMREVKVGKFDAVITIFNAIGHLTRADFERALQNIRDNLKEDGIYIFDIFNLQAIKDGLIRDFSMDIEKVIEGIKVRNIQYSELDREQGLLTSHDHYTIYQKEGEPKQLTNSFSLQIYTAKELQTILEHNGFEVLERCDMDGCEFVPDNSISMLTVAKKRSVT